jgi:hypothetical protein
MITIKKGNSTITVLQTILKHQQIQGIVLVNRLPVFSGPPSAFSLQPSAFCLLRLPYHLKAGITGHYGVARDDRQVAFMAFGDQDPVKRIIMEVWKQYGCLCHSTG